MAIKLKELEWFAETTEFTDEPVRLSQCEVITNQKQFVESHLAVLKANSGKKLVMPYYIRLVKFYKIITNGRK